MYNLFNNLSLQKLLSMSTKQKLPLIIKKKRRKTMSKTEIFQGLAQILSSNEFEELKQAKR